MARTVSARLPDELDAQLEQYRNQFEKFPPDQSEVVREALRQYLAAELDDTDVVEQ
jgi:Arc/MetJ-type ribon-helix-helix transcriptional regulator